MKTFVAFTFFILVRIGLAHEGHGIPGALPPAPHGGIVQEVADAEEPHHDHEHGDEEHDHSHAEGKEETELFVEVTYKDKEISIYPLVLNPQKRNAFSQLPVKSLSKLHMKAEFPRAKKFEPLAPKVTDEAIKAAFDSKNANRFIVHVGMEFEKEMKLAKVQIERK